MLLLPRLLHSEKTMHSPNYFVAILLLLTPGSSNGVGDSPSSRQLKEDFSQCTPLDSFTALALQASSAWSNGKFDASISDYRTDYDRNIPGIRGGSGEAKLGVGSTSTDKSYNETSSSKPPSSAATEGWKNSIASGLASVCAKTFLQPFDTIKTVQQHSQGEITLSLMQAMHVVIQREGDWKALYAGLTVSALGSIPSISLYYGIYSFCKRILISWMLEAKQQHNNKMKKRSDTGSNQALKLIVVAISAAIGNTIASFSRVPSEVVKQKLQTGQYANTNDAIVSLFRQSSLRAFFPPGGIAIQMLRDVPYAIVTLLVYEYLRDVWNADQDRRVWKDMTIGAIAGGTGSFMTNGLDVLKTRLQTSAPEVYGGSILKCARTTFQEGGIAAFLRGSTSRLMHKMPANAFFFYFFEMFRTLLKVDRSALEQHTSIAAKNKR